MFSSSTVAGLTSRSEMLRILFTVAAVILVIQVRQLFLIIIYIGPHMKSDWSKTMFYQSIKHRKSLWLMFYQSLIHDIGFLYLLIKN